MTRLRAPFTQRYVHLIWSTWDRLPLITEAIEPRLHAIIAAKCRQLKCQPLAIGNVCDHIHVLVMLHPTTCVSELAKEVKGASSHLMTHEVIPGEFFKWQGAYRAFTIRKEDVARVKAYIENQKQHHAEGQLLDAWEPGSEDGDKAIEAAATDREQGNRRRGYAELMDLRQQDIGHQAATGN